MQLNDPVRSILQRKRGEIWTVSPHASVYDAMAMMSDHNVGALLVMEADLLVGVIAERDYARKIALKGKSSRETPVEDIISKNPVTVSPAEKVFDCMRLMSEKRVRHLPVLDDGRIVGVISIGDLVNRIISTQSATIEHLEKYIAGELG